MFNKNKRKTNSTNTNQSNEHKTAQKCLKLALVKLNGQITNQNLLNPQIIEI